MTEYKLSASLPGHEDDVRAVCYPSSKAVVSASRDGTVRLWSLLSDNPPTYDDKICLNASGFVNAVSYLSPTQQYPEGLVISGGQDTVIEVRQPSKGPSDNAEALLLGHSRNVCALDVDPAGEFIVSGAWDSEARIWPVGKWESQTVLTGHEGSVWAVLAFDKETVITASADKLIRVFHTSGKLLRKIKGSGAPVRALCRIPKGHASGADFASACNEGIIRLWTMSGTQVGELKGHESFIYSLAVTPSGELISAGEDRTLRIWRGNECIQTITHPAISVWSVAVCAETGDIVSGASDRLVRVFTKSQERVAAAEATREFEKSVKESAIPQEQVGEVNKENLPGPEFLVQKQGTKEGQVQMIKEHDGSVTAHTWSAGAATWINVGTVVASAGSNGKKVSYNGQEYDFVFDVDIEDGKPALKLPYNLSQNPYEAATTFIGNNELPVSYLDQVANFITTNTQGATIGQSEPQAQGPSDPWGSDNRYRPGETSSPAPPKPPKVLPQKTYLSILVARIPPIQKKIQELNQALINDGHKDLSLNPTDLAVLASLCKHLEAVDATKASQVDPPELELAVKMATTWPYKDRLPSLDLLRLLAVAPKTAKYSSPGGNFVDVLIAGATEVQPPLDNNVMMVARAFANLFESPEGRTLAVSEFDKIQGLISTTIRTSTNRNLLVAATTVYINYAVYFVADTTSTNFEHVLALIYTLGKILDTQADSEVVYRALVAIGTLITVDEEAKNAAKEVYGIEKSIATALGKASDPRIRNVAAEIRTLLK